MNDLMELVKNLEQETNEKQQIQILQEINEELLTKYALKVGELVIIPLWVEAYYYHEMNFPDVTSHRSPRQQNHLGKLYQHAKTEINGGIDICLTDSKEYYLSFLIKSALVNGEFCTQEKINGKLIKTGLDIENQEDVLIECEREGEIYHTHRIGLTNENYKNLPLASLPIHEIKNYPFDNKERIVKEYLDDLFRTEREKRCCELLGYRSKYVIGE